MKKSRLIKVNGRFLYIFQGEWHLIPKNFRNFALVITKKATPIVPTGYIMTTAADASKYSAPNPKSWTIKSKAGSGDERTTNSSEKRT